MRSAKRLRARVREGKGARKRAQRIRQERAAMIPKNERLMIAEDVFVGLTHTEQDYLAIDVHHGPAIPPPYKSHKRPATHRVGVPSHRPVTTQSRRPDMPQSSRRRVATRR